jgi:hypothetical protein
MDIEVLTKQLAFEKLARQFERVLREKGLFATAADDLAQRAIDSGRFRIDQSGRIDGDDPARWLEILQEKGQHPHLFQALDPDAEKRERSAFYGHTKKEFAALSPEKKLALANENSPWGREQAALLKKRGY